MSKFHNGLFINTILIRIESHRSMEKVETRNWYRRITNSNPYQRNYPSHISVTTTHRAGYQLVKSSNDQRKSKIMNVDHRGLLKLLLLFFSSFFSSSLLTKFFVLTLEFFTPGVFSNSNVLLAFLFGLLY